MCPIHHDVIDDDPISYTAERLTDIKRQHESSAKTAPQPSEISLEDLLESVERNPVSRGSLIFTQNQMGGQVAHTITNVGPQPRHVSPEAGSALVSLLRANVPEVSTVAAILGNPESIALATDLENLLRLGGWNTSGGVSQHVYTGMPKGLQIHVGAQNDANLALLRWALNCGLRPLGRLSPSQAGVHILVGYQ